MVFFFKGSLQAILVDNAVGELAKNSTFSNGHAKIFGFMVGGNILINKLDVENDAGRQECEVSLLLKFTLKSIPNTVDIELQSNVNDANFSLFLIKI